jgi:hypothetical protein
MMQKCDECGKMVKQLIGLAQDIDDESKDRFLCDKCFAETVLKITIATLQTSSAKESEAKYPTEKWDKHGFN